MYKLADGTNSTDYKIGDRFKVVKEDTFTVGSIVEFYGDDGSHCPKFKLITGGCDYNHCGGGQGTYESWENLKSTNKQGSNIKEAITTLQSLIAWPEITLELSEGDVFICVFDRKFSTLGEDVEAMVETVNMLVGQEVPQ